MSSKVAGIVETESNSAVAVVEAEDNSAGIVETESNSVVAVVEAEDNSAGAVAVAGVENNSVVAVAEVEDNFVAETTAIVAAADIAVAAGNCLKFEDFAAVAGPTDFDLFVAAEVGTEHNSAEAEIGDNFVDIVSSIHSKAEDSGMEAKFD